MKQLFCGLLIMCCWQLMFAKSSLFAQQTQDFESSFRIVSAPEEFLPNWSANEVRGTSARVFQANGQGRNGSRALAVQPISGFNGQVFVRLDIGSFVFPKLAFFARSGANGSGNRTAEVFVSFSKDGGDSFGQRIQVGNANSFPNATTPYRLYEVSVPDFYRDNPEIVLKIEVNFGVGTGSAARFFMDDFGIYENDEEVDPIRVQQARLLNPFQVLLEFDRPILPPTLSQIQPQGWTISEVVHQRARFLLLEIGGGLYLERYDLELLDLQDQDEASTGVIAVSIDNSQALLGDVWILSPDRLRLSFSQSVDAASIVQSSIFSIVGQQPSEVKLLESQHEVELILVSPLLIGQSFDVKVGPFRNVEGTKTDKSSLLVDYRVPISDIFVLDDVTIELQFHEALAGFIERFQFRESDMSISHEILDDRRLVQLNLESPLEEFLVYELIVPLGFTLEGATSSGAFVDVIYDRTPPELISVLSLSATRLLFIFSEPIDRVFAVNTDQFQVGDLFPTRIEFTESASELILEFERPFGLGEVYPIVYQGIVDMFGNEQAEGRYKFIFQERRELVFKDIIINELMPAPRAGNTLPNVEYVELYNRTEEVIALEGLQLANSRRATQIPTLVLQPKSYVLLVPRNQVQQFTAFGQALGLTNWPTLLNSADQVRLIDSRGIVIDSLSYSAINFGGSAFATGGYSLEIVNPDILCDLPSNLTASSSPKRGTPGKTNANFDPSPDRSLFKLERASVIDSQRVALNFSKVLGDTSRLIITFNPALEVQQVFFGADRSVLELKLGEGIKQGKLYELKVEKLWDCTGRSLEEKANTAVVVWPFEAEAGEVVINELLANPRSGTPRFVEIYNAGDRYIDLMDWKLAHVNSAGEVASRRILFTEHFVLEPYEFLVFTTDAVQLKQEYPRGRESRFISLPSLPSYPIAGGTVVLLNSDESISEEFTYSDRMHHRLLRDSRGVSLERLSPRVPSQNPDNWSSASSSAGFATPGYKNSQRFTFGDDVLGIRIDPEIFIPEGPGEQGFCTISYQMEQAGMVGSIYIYSVDGRMVKEICQNAIWGNQGLYVWDGVDDLGRKVRPGYYVVFVELYDLEGRVKQVKKTVAVGTRF